MPPDDYSLIGEEQRFLGAVGLLEVAPRYGVFSRRDTSHQRPAADDAAAATEKRYLRFAIVVSFGRLAKQALGWQEDGFGRKSGVASGEVGASFLVAQGISTRRASSRRFSPLTKISTSSAGSSKASRRSKVFSSISSIRLFYSSPLDWSAGACEYVSGLGCWKL